MTEIVRRYSTFSDEYAEYRPTPPTDLIKFVQSMAPNIEKGRVIDLGCGTGLSTRVWSDFCAEAIGVEPSDEMLKKARMSSHDRNISFIKGWGHDTSLPDDSASVVTCAASFHWMEPESTLREIKRILQPGGILAIYGPQVPPVPLGHYEVASLCQQFLDSTKKADVLASGGTSPQAIKWAEILKLLKDPNHAKYSNEYCFHDTNYWKVADLYMWIQTLSYVNSRIRSGDQAIIEDFKLLQEKCTSLLGAQTHPFLWCYRLIFGIL